MKRAFFRRLWQYNALVIAGIGTVVLLMLVLTVVLPALWSTGSPGSDQQFLPDIGERNVRPRLQGLTHIDGTPYLSIIVGVPDDEQPYSSTSSSSSSFGNDDRNVLLIDSRTGISRYVLPDNSRALRQWYVLRTGGDREAAGPARAYAALVSKAGPVKSDGSIEGGFDLLVGNFATGRQIWVARGLAAAEAPQLLDDNHVGVLVWEGDKLAYRIIDLTSFETRLSKDIPIWSVNADG